MFGQRKLSKVGVRAFADVLQAEQSIISVTIGNPNLVNNTEVRWTLRLRVTPEYEPSFDATLKTLLPQSVQPRPGSRLAVIYDPKDHGRIELDHPSAAETAIDAVTASRPDLAGASVMGMPMGDVIRQAMADPGGFRTEMMRRAAEMQEQALQAMPPQAPARDQDVLDRLERLAALKDRGVLTDDEFEQQKRRILGTQTGEGTRSSSRNDGSRTQNAPVTRIGSASARNATCKPAASVNGPASNRPSGPAA